MGVAGDDLGDAADAGAAARVARQQRRLGMGFVEIFDDGERFEQGRPVAVTSAGSAIIGLTARIAGLALRALYQIDIDHLVGVTPLRLSAMRTR